MCEFPRPACSLALLPSAPMRATELRAQLLLGGLRRNRGGPCRARVHVGYSRASSRWNFYSWASPAFRTGSITPSSIIHADADERLQWIRIYIYTHPTEVRAMTPAAHVPDGRRGGGVVARAIRPRGELYGFAWAGQDMPCWLPGSKAVRSSGLTWQSHVGRARDLRVGGKRR